MKILNRKYAIHTLFESFTKRIRGKCEEQLPEKPLGRFSAFVSVCQRLSAFVGRQLSYRRPICLWWPTVGRYSVTCR